MTEAEIITAVGRGIRDPNFLTTTRDDVRTSILVAVRTLGLKIDEIDSSYFNRFTSLSSETYIFPWPSDCATIQKVEDMGGTADDITDATNASPIVVTQAAHGLESDALRIVHSVGGNTAANGTWKITVIDADTYSLNGSTGNAVYTSGGKSFSPPSSPSLISRKLLSEANLGDSSHWYPRGRNIVVDDDSFTDDILIHYSLVPDAIDDIPEQFHFGIVSFCVWNMIIVPAQEAQDFTDKTNSYQRHLKQWDFVNRRIEETMSPASELTQMRDVWAGEFEL